MHEGDAELALRHYAEIFSLRAKYLRRDAAKLRTGFPSANLPEEDPVKVTRLAKITEQADQWEAIAHEALEGYLLVFADNEEFQTEPYCRPLIDLCCAAGRCIYVDGENQLSSGLKCRAQSQTRAIPRGGN